MRRTQTIWDRPFDNILLDQVLDNKLITLTDGKGEDRQWFYDERNLATTKTYPLTTGNDFYTTTYDALRRPVVKTDQ